jgi:tripartite-type tricarboxylate transporter receptor subunit TctC
MNHFVKLPNDGYHIYIASHQGIWVTSEFANPETKKYSIDDIEYGLTLAKSPLAIIAHHESPTNSPREFMDRMKNPQKPISIAAGSGAHKLAYEYMMYNIKGNRELIKTVPYKGPAQAVQDVAGNQVEFGILPTAIAYPLVKAGKVKYIALAGEQRLAQIPEVPLWKDSVPGLNVYAAWMIMLPPGSPREQVEYYNKLFVPAINSAEAKKMFDENLMFTVKAEQTPDGARAYMSRLINQWTPYVKRIPPN